ncbi:c-type cytochrome biogenesis protein CcmI [Notoacmeibacter ruber]|nr:c-type cytochrome biogenesis protein CcmI [Notoacmeibacter ruber]
MMMFWTIAALMTFAVMAAILFALPKQGLATENANAAADEAVYREQLAALDREIERGSLDEPTAAEARAEIGRRLLHAREQHEERQRHRVPKVYLFLALLAVPLGAWAFYSVLGEPTLPSQPLQARLEQDPRQSSVSELIARAERALNENPSDVRGWAALAPIYMRVGRFEDAANAYRALLRLSGESAPGLAALAEAEIAAADGVVTADAKTRLERALELQPAEPRARYFLALAARQEGDTAEAVRLWNELAESQEPDSPWFAAARQAAQLAAAEPAAEGGPGPSADDVSAASKLSTEDRQAMIGQMVSGLDARLEENGGSIDEWLRLINAYRVMGDTEKGTEAVRRALKAFEGDEAAREKIRSAAEALSQSGDAAPPSDDSETRS